MNNDEYRVCPCRFSLEYKVLAYLKLPYKRIKIVQQLKLIGNFEGGEDDHFCIAAYGGQSLLSPCPCLVVYL